MHNTHPGPRSPARPAFAPQTWKAQLAQNCSAPGRNRRPTQRLSHSPLGGGRRLQKVPRAQEPRLELTPTRSFRPAPPSPRAPAPFPGNRGAVAAAGGAGLPAGDAAEPGYKRRRLRRAGRNFPERSVRGGGAAAARAAYSNALLPAPPHCLGPLTGEFPPPIGLSSRSGSPLGSPGS